MVAELGTKLRKISFSLFLSTKLPKSKWQDEFKGKSANLPVNPSIISTNDTLSYWQRWGPLLDLIFGRFAFLGEKKAFCILGVELWRALLVIEYSFFSSPAGYWRFNICRNSHGEANKITVCLQSHSTAWLPASCSNRVKATAMLCHRKFRRVDDIANMQV